MKTRLTLSTAAVRALSGCSSRMGSTMPGSAGPRAAAQLQSTAGNLADIVGKGLIVHAQPDDHKTQLTGNSGARLACAEITRS